MNRKTLELLLINYNNINNSLKPCAEKTKFINLIAEVEQKLKTAPLEVKYPDGLTAIEYAKKLASEANERYNNE